MHFPFSINKSMNEILNYKFAHPSLLHRALTHRSISQDSNERLEFLGDSVLSLIVSSFLFESYKSRDEGELTAMRAYLVREESLFESAKNIGLDKLIIASKSELNNGDVKTSVLADCLEAVFGAIFIDGGLKNAEDAVLLALKPRIDTLDTAILKDSKTTLKERLAKMGEENIEYITYKETGPDHDKTFYVHLNINKKEIASGIGKSKKDAQQNAAREALNILNI